MIRASIFSILVSFMLAGCGFNLDFELDDTPEAQVESTRASVNTLQVGDVCGVDATKVCDAGLSCQYDDNEQGTCQAKDLDASLICTKEKDPVCGLKGRELLGYLNECEANRHKAQIVNEGFCAPKDVAEDCGESVYSLGNCATRFEGFEFNAGTGSCDAVVIRGCELQAPFTDLETCNSSCAS